MEGQDINFIFIFQALTPLDNINDYIHLRYLKRKSEYSLQFHLYIPHVKLIRKEKNQFAFNILHRLSWEKSLGANLIGSDIPQTLIWQITEENIDLSEELRSVAMIFTSPLHESQ